MTEKRDNRRERERERAAKEREKATRHTHREGEREKATTERENPAKEKNQQERCTEDPHPPTGTAPCRSGASLLCGSAVAWSD